MWECREEYCSDFNRYSDGNIGNRTDLATGLEEHYCKTCDVPLVRWMQDPDDDASEWAWRRVGWTIITHTEEWEELVTKTRIWYENVRVPISNE